jgi:hypothetical protein
MSDTRAVLAEGPLEGLAATAADPIAYRLVLGQHAVDLADRLGTTLRLDTDGHARCRHCERTTPRRYGGAYCYRCFTSLARCDLCIVSPDRCHYAAGTCREPEWGAAHCMRPHRVYLADSGGAKVGITSVGNVPGRFIDQGASAALVIAETTTRQVAGFVEKALGRHVREQSDWRGIVAGRDTGTDLDAELARVRRASASALAEVDARFPGAVRWLEAPLRFTFHYPVLRYDAPVRQLRLVPGRPVGGTLLGVRGSYLLFDRGVFNVRAHEALHVRVGVADVPESGDDPSQMELFR